MNLQRTLTAEWISSLEIPQKRKISSLRTLWTLGLEGISFEDLYFKNKELGRGLLYNYLSNILNLEYLVDIADDSNVYMSTGSPVRYAKEEKFDIRGRRIWRKGDGYSIATTYHPGDSRTEVMTDASGHMGPSTSTRVFNSNGDIIKYLSGDTPDRDAIYSLDSVGNVLSSTFVDGSSAASYVVMPDGRDSMRVTKTCRGDEVVIIKAVTSFDGDKTKDIVTVTCSLRAKLDMYSMYPGSPESKWNVTVLRDKGRVGVSSYRFCLDNQPTEEEILVLSSGPIPAGANVEELVMEYYQSGNIESITEGKRVVRFPNLNPEKNIDH
mgnify:CR=1 FL=1